MVGDIFAPLFPHKIARPSHGTHALFEHSLLETTDQIFSTIMSSQKQNFMDGGYVKFIGAYVFSFPGYEGSDIMQPKTHSSDAKSKDAEKTATKRGFPEDVTLWSKVNDQIVVPYEFDRTTRKYWTKAFACSPLIPLRNQNVYEGPSNRCTLWNWSR